MWPPPWPKWVETFERRLVLPIYARRPFSPAGFAVLRLLVAHWCSYWMLNTFPVASEGSIGTVIVRTFFLGPAVWTVVATLGSIRTGCPFKMHFPLQSLGLILNSDLIQDACATVSRTPGHSSVFRSLERGLDSVGLWLIDFVSPLFDKEHVKEEFARRLVLPCSNPCAAFHLFLYFWAGFAVPLVLAWYAETRRNRGATETIHRGGSDGRNHPERRRGNDFHGNGFSIVVLLLNAVLSWEVSWRVAKKMNTD